MNHPAHFHTQITFDATHKIATHNKYLNDSQANGKYFFLLFFFWKLK